MFIKSFKISTRIYSLIKRKQMFIEKSRLTSLRKRRGGLVICGGHQKFSVHASSTGLSNRSYVVLYQLRVWLDKCCLMMGIILILMMMMMMMGGWMCQEKVNMYCLQRIFSIKNCLYRYCDCIKVRINHGRKTFAWRK